MTRKLRQRDTVERATGLRSALRPWRFRVLDSISGVTADLCQAKIMQVGPKPALIPYNTTHSQVQCLTYRYASCSAWSLLARDDLSSAQQEMGSLLESMMKTEVVHGKIKTGPPCPRSGAGTRLEGSLPTISAPAQHVDIEQGQLPVHTRTTDGIQLERTSLVSVSLSSDASAFARCSFSLSHSTRNRESAWRSCLNSMSIPRNCSAFRFSRDSRCASFCFHSSFSRLYWL